MQLLLRIMSATTLAMLILGLILLGFVGAALAYHSASNELYEGDWGGFDRP